METSTQRPFLRWAGSKRKILPCLIASSPKRYRRYVEPFAGSAALFFALQPPKALLGDFNPELIQTYQCLASSAAIVWRRLNKMPDDSEYYYQLRDQLPTKLRKIDRSARFIYLNRYCFNGVYRTNRLGRFNVPRGIRTGSLPTLEEFKLAGKCLRGAEMFCGDFAKCLERVRSGDFVYLDPPYTRKGARYSGEYGYGAFASNDLDRLYQILKIIDKRGAFFLLSYRWSPALIRRSSGWYVQTLSVRRHVAGFQHGRKVVREVLVSNYKRNG